MRSANTTHDSAMLDEYLAVLPRGAVRCPACKGGRTGEKTFRLLQADYCVVGRCFRASCGFSVTQPKHGAANDDRYQPPRVNPYTGPLRGLDAAEREWMKKRYGFALVGVGTTDDGRYVLPIWDETAAERGVVLRVPHDGSPLRASAPPYGGPKAVTYRSAEGPTQSWYLCKVSELPDVVVLVEDQISALKVRYFAGLTAVALLGTELSNDKVAEIQRVARHVILALDPDATMKSFALARRWGKAFASCRVLCLSRDIKDADSGEWLSALLNLAASSRRSAD